MKQTVSHGSFSLEREYPVPPERVFAAFSTREAKISWFAQGDEFLAEMKEYTLDFQVGGRERLDATSTSGNRLVVETTFNDIVENERIVATYDVKVNDRRISVSLWSVQLIATENGTRLITNEDGAFLDDLDDSKNRQSGVERDLEQLRLYLERNSVPAAV